MAKIIDSVKNRLAKALSLRGMKPVDLSKQTKISKSSISQYLSGYSKPNSERTILISKALNINESWLLGFDVPMERETLAVSDDVKYNPDPNNITLSENEAYLLNTFRSLSDQGQEYILQTIEMVKDKYKKDICSSDLQKIS